jgi:flagellar biosynthesis protein FlhG
MDQADRLRNLMETKKVDTPYTFKNRLITVTSGKGGVGKSNFTLNLAISLSEAGKKVVIVDADFGMANIEVLYGATPKKSLLNVLKGENNISDVITEGPGGISVISGGSGLTELATLNEKQVEFLIETFTFLESRYDFILIDTGAGASHQGINMVKASNETIIVTTPEPTALTDAYTMIKILKKLEHIPEMFIVINKTEDKREGEEIYFKLNRVSHRFLDLNLKLLGYVPNDDMLGKAVRAQKPVILEFPKSLADKAIRNIANEVLASENPLTSEKLTGNESAGFINRFIKFFSK